jgi:2'-5' RNA ligase
VSAGGRLRLFAALDLPEEVRAALAEAFAGVGGPWRPLPEEKLHVTLAFLGGRPEDEVEPIAAALAPLARPVPDLALGRLRVRARVLAVDVEDGAGALVALQADVVAALVALGVYEPEARPFWPHVTVARLRAQERARRQNAAPPAARFAGEALTLYVSRLGRPAARYEPLSRFSLH